MSEWGPWINHDGKGVPLCVIGREIEVYAEQIDGSFTSQIGIITSGQSDNVNLRCWNWSFAFCGNPGSGWAYAKILKYRIRRASAIEQLRELAANPPQMETPAELEAV